MNTLPENVLAHGHLREGAGRIPEETPGEGCLVSDKFTAQCANGKPTAMAGMIEMQLKLDRFGICWIHNV